LETVQRLLFFVSLKKGRLPDFDRTNHGQGKVLARQQRKIVELIS
jgi:hypothetical protein